MNISVIGAGQLGAGIAQFGVLAGYSVSLYDISPQAIQRTQLQIARTLENMVTANVFTMEQANKARAALTSTTILEACGESQIVFECVPEELELKKTLFQRLDEITPEMTVLATCTNLIPITLLAAAAKKYPERVIGAKFSGPIPSAKVLEVIQTNRTAPHAIDRILTFGQTLRKGTVLVKDRPGFLVDPIVDAYTREALFLLEEGQIDARSIDRLMESLDFKTGPFLSMDTTGLDQVLGQKNALFQALDGATRFRPHLLLRQNVQAGHLGKKTKQGFHTYDE